MRLRTDRVTVSQEITGRPCFIGCVIVTPDSAITAADITLHNGSSTTDPQILTIRTDAGVTRTYPFVYPLHCDRGLFVSLGSNVEEVIIQWMDNPGVKVYNPGIN